jgi:hypothetical protein
MPSPYFAQIPPYMQPVNLQEQQGLMPVFQNMAAQQANQNAALQQQNQQVQQAGQVQGGGGSMNPLAMAAMLRNKQGGTGNLGARADMALNSQASPYLQDQVSQLGSSTFNPLSNYNMGTNGWGNYGE